MVLIYINQILAQNIVQTNKLPTTIVEDQILEESKIGPYSQPEWTYRRRFSTTRVYVQKEPWQAGVEQWWRGRFYKDGSASHLLQEEFEIGLPHRFQFDLYENWIVDKQGIAHHHDVATELRWALADWGKIPLNPTIYGEWKSVDKSQGPDVYEFKLLLGEELMPNLHWGLNMIYEQEVGGERATEMAWSQGLSYALIDSKFSAGLEMSFKHETTSYLRSQPEIKFSLGPSFQWRPTPKTHLDIVPLFGLTHDAPSVEAFLVFGYDFGKPGSYSPSSLKGQ